MRTRHLPWLVAAVVLLVAAAWLMSGAEEPALSPSPEVSFPRKMDESARERAVARRTFVPGAHVVAIDAGEVKASPPRGAGRDPLFAALPSDVKEVAMVIEFNALRHSAMGELLVECITSRDNGAGLAKLREAGVDVFSDIDRVGMSDGVAVLTGHFQQAQWEKLLSPDAPARTFGDKGQLFEREFTSPRGERVSQHFGVWNEQMLLVGRSREELEATIDRLEGREDPGTPALSEDQTYGDLYGKISGRALAEAVGREDPELASFLEKAAEWVDVHADASGDLAMVANFSGQDADAMGELSRMMGGALAVARATAQEKQQDELAQLLDLARLKRSKDGSFRMELAVPAQLIESRLRECIERNSSPRRVTEGEQ